MDFEGDSGDGSYRTETFSDVVDRESGKGDRCVRHAESECMQLLTIIRGEYVLKEWLQR